MFFLVKTTLFISAGDSNVKTEIVSMRADKNELVSHLFEILGKMLSNMPDNSEEIMINDYYLKEFLEMDDAEKRAVVLDSLIVDIPSSGTSVSDRVFCTYSIGEYSYNKG